MSAALAIRVFESDLPSTVKQVAVCCALYADDDGIGVPSMRDLMWLLDKSYRSILRETADLRRLDILRVAGRNGKELAFCINVGALRPKPVFVPRGTDATDGTS